MFGRIKGGLMKHQIEYVCDKCKKPIPNSKGFLWINLDDIAEYRIELRVWITEGRHGRPPLKPRWKAHHGKCVQVREPIRSVRVESVRDERGLMRVTESLMQKDAAWLSLTDWLDYLRSVAYVGGTEWFNGSPR